ncbi:Acyl transferase/acyl hydrolase/lysophospholipase [Penicillium expansum]|nr:Acyl transferase/acyl hydrolase/lysophospholipase [Penicillium expansum]
MIDSGSGKQLLSSVPSDSQTNGNTNEHTNGHTAGETAPTGVSQSPIAIVGLACRLPGHVHTPKDLWDLMARGGVAETKPPSTRFNLDGHYDGSKKPFTMKTPGAMFLEDVDPADFDAQFFNINHMDASSMDPQQRILMEVAYECLENAGIPVESLGGKRIGCLVGASAVDYHDMTCRDPEDRTESPTMGTGRALLSNRISHYLNVHGPSMTIDTACSSTLIALDMACLYLSANQCDGILVGGVNMYLSPERNQDMGAMRPTASATGKCHTFDANADGYVAAEAINAVFLKRLDDAVRDRDPIRAIIRGTATNSAGRTPGIAMPNDKAQAAAIRMAYANAGIPEAELSHTGYLECHGTGTLVGDPIEVNGAASVFAESKSTADPLIIGSVKSNIGHSEAAAGLSGLIKAVLAVEKGIIPGTATFITPNPKIDFEKNRVRASRNALAWPANTKKRASINSFGFGGANAHAIIEAPEYLLRDRIPKYKSTFANREGISEGFFDDSDDEDSIEDSGVLTPSLAKPTVIVLSAEDENSLKASIKRLSAHILNPAVQVELDDLAFTLSERRSKLYHRAYSLQTDTQITSDTFQLAKPLGRDLRIGFIFTGQGAQWPAMGKQLLEAFPLARSVVESLDTVLQSLPEPPSWSLVSELTEDRDSAHLRKPEFSQPLVTALQLALLAVLSQWGIRPARVVGHSSGEIAAAVAAGYLTSETAIKVAFFRGQAGKQLPPQQAVGMLAVGLSAHQIEAFIDSDDDLVQIACFNSPRSLTVSGTVAALERLRDRLQAENHFARLLQVNYAYHSKYMSSIGKRYLEMLNAHGVEASQTKSTDAVMFSSVTGAPLENPVDATYWLDNMVSQVRFDQAASEMLKGKDGVNFLVELGPSNALKGPVAQIIDAITSSIEGPPIYTSAAQRGTETLQALYHVAGRLFTAGGTVDLARVNEYSVQDPPFTLVDLPNYVWNHSKKYWHESPASKDWRARPFLKHDLLGTKVLGTPWQAPTWRNTLRLNDHPWLKDHRIGDQVVFPGAGYVAMAMEAIYQTMSLTEWTEGVPARYRFRLRDMKFFRALVLDSSYDSKVILNLTPNKSWYEYKVSSRVEDIIHDHASGLIRIETDFLDTPAPVGALAPLQTPVSARVWYKAMREAGFNFGPSFQKHLSMEYQAGQQSGRSTVSLEAPASAWPQSSYPIHPACMDGCFQTVLSSAWKGDRSAVDAALVPLSIDSLVIPWNTDLPVEAFAVAKSEFTGVGRADVAKNYSASTAVYHPVHGNLLLEMKGLRYTELDSSSPETQLAHSYGLVKWDADVSLLSETGFHQLVAGLDAEGEAAQGLIDTIAHKRPGLTVLEVDLDSEAPARSLWLDRADTVTRAACTQYQFASSDANRTVAIQNAYPSATNAEFTVSSFATAEVAVSQQFDLVVLQLPAQPGAWLGQALANLRNSLTENGIGLIVHADKRSRLDVHAATQVSEWARVWSAGVVTLVQVAPQAEADHREVYRVRFRKNDNTLGGLFDTALSQAGGWKSIPVWEPEQVPPRSKVLVLDELEQPVMSKLGGRQWAMLQLLIQNQCDLLWVTSGAQMEVSQPTQAAIIGFLRVLRNEEPLLRLISLDVESPTAKDPTVGAIDRCLHILTAAEGPRTHIDSEYVERGGIVHISRVLPDTTVNEAQKEEAMGRPAQTMELHAAPNCIRLRAERIGNIDAVRYNEVSSAPLPLETNRVEVEIYASGVNFKEVAVTVGIVPDNEHLLGGEGAGIITRVAPDVTDFKPGQRVAFFQKGSFANRIITTTQRVYPIADTMSFEEASTIPCVFMTSMYGLYRLAHLKKGDRVLIHSATGGVGLSAIQLSQYKGAEVYATAGTPEKRDFLKAQFGIPEERIFSSRTKAFAEQILACTGGKGVDVILNSLTGDLLDESWRIIADGGTMVEIGKKDILDRSSLAMEPFNRNASFRALDLSHKEITDDTIASLLADIFTLMQGGHLSPITPMHIFSFRDIPAAFRLLRSGKHIGKLVISDGPDAKVEVPVRPAPRRMSLSPDKSYLIVGGLRGLCSSLAIYLAQNGAKHLAVITRSGHEDEQSQKIVRDLHALGCQVDLLRGDISNLSHVRSAFAATRVPIGGIVQGAMVLRDRTFAGMSLDDYHTALRCKVAGTWNLHQVALEQDLSLDFFTMLSSVSGLCGSKGQANYAAGNTFLDAFASYRQRLGLVACSINLGVIQDVGYMAERDDLQDRYDAALWHAINERLLRRIFGFSILQQDKIPINKTSSANLVTGIQVPQPADSFLLRDARFAGLYLQQSGQQTQTVSDSKDIQAIFVLLRSKAEPAAVLEVTVDVLNRYLTTSLRLPEALDVARPLSTYGIDSLAAVEFRNWLRIELGVDLNTLEIVNAPSLVSICEKVILKIPNP